MSPHVKRDMSTPVLLDAGIQQQVYRLVEALTDKKRRVVDERELKALKNLLKASNAFVAIAYNALKASLASNHAQVSMTPVPRVRQIWQGSKLKAAGHVGMLHCT